MVFCSTLGALVSFFIGIVNPRVVNKAGPDWLWLGGRDDAIRALYFKPNGAFRRYGFIALIVTLAAGSAALFWLGARL
jgi:membrane protein YqaA with SNARE-associated domain